MRTLKSTLFNRIVAQAEEADRKGLTKVADSLTKTASENAVFVRDDDDFYRYPREDFNADVNHALWRAVVRVADFYGIKRFDAEEVQALVDKTAEQLVTGLCTHAGIEHGVGAHEEPVAGEYEIAIEVDE